MRRRRRKRTFPTALGAVLRAVYPAPDDFDNVRVFSWWVRSVPPRIVSNARPVLLRRGELKVHVSSSVWAQELHYMSDDLLKRVQAFAPEARVKSLRFVVGKLPDLPTPVVAADPVTIQPPRTEDIPEDLGRALAGIQDDDLRQTIAKAATARVPRSPTQN